MATSDAERTRPSGGDGAVVVQGNIAARIDRLPLTRIQYVLAGITQLYWGILIDTDGIISRLYPFVWEPMGITTFQYSLLYAANTGAGILAGMYIGGPLSDRYGRKKILVLSAVLDAMFLWPLAHTNTFGWLLLWHLLYGIGLGFMLATNNVYLQEIAPPGQRHKLSMRAQMLTGVCTFLPGILGILFVPENYVWFIYGLVIAVILLIPIGLLFLPESPRWLEQKGRVAEADAIVSKWERKIEARFGPLPEPVVQGHTVVQTQKVPLRELISGNYRTQVLVLMLVWSLGYAGHVYGESAYLPTYLKENGWSADETFFWQSIMAAVVRIGGFFLISYLGERFERKDIVGWIGIANGLVFLLLFFPGFFGLQVFIVLVSVPLGSLWLFNMYNYTSQAFPTRIRASGYAWTNGFGHTAAVWGPILMAPLFAATASSGHWAWIIWIAIPGAIIPSLMMMKWGMRQKGRTLEETAE